AGAFGELPMSDEAVQLGDLRRREGVVVDAGVVEYAMGGPAIREVARALDSQSPRHGSIFAGCGVGRERLRGFQFAVDIDLYRTGGSVDHSGHMIKLPRGIGRRAASSGYRDVSREVMLHHKLIGVGVAQSGRVTLLHN